MTLSMHSSGPPSPAGPRMKVPGRRGRPPGSKNKKTLALEALASAGLDRRQQELAMQVRALVAALCTALHGGRPARCTAAPLGCPVAAHPVMLLGMLLAGAGLLSPLRCHLQQLCWGPASRHCLTL